MKFENVSFTYSPNTAFEIHALKNINMEIRDGEFIGIIGHTGSGKSTLVQHFNGLMKATSGAIYYNGENIYAEGYSMKNLRSKVGLVFQYPEHQLFEVDVLTDVCFGPKNLGLSKEEAEKRAKKALQMVGLKEKYYKQSPFEMSGGQKRRVAIAGVLAMEPEVLILDEPTAGLDPKGRDEILEQLKRIHEERHITIILVSHSMEDVAKYVGRIIVMNQGEAMYDGTPKEVFSHYRELEEVGLAAPQVTYIMNALAEKGFGVSVDATTIQEAAEEIFNAYQKR
jgi:energy-coupling factor transport system ATP-binding protein